MVPAPYAYMQYVTICFLLLTSGIFGIDKRIVAQCSYKALLEFEEHRLWNPSSNQTLINVYFVNIDVDTAKIMEKVFRSGTDNVDDFDSKQTSLPGSEEKNIQPGVVRTPASPAVVAPGATNNKIDPNDKPNVVPIRGRRPLLKNDHCMICMDSIDGPKRLDCGHSFCTACIDQYFAMGQPKCPICGKLFGVLRGNQPPGTFHVNKSRFRLDGYRDCGSIEITYNIPDGIQTVSVSCFTLFAFVSYYTLFT
jgi:Zinc finger, C3HC4 type (RING finger)/Deltex C-terminal domain